MKENLVAFSRLITIMDELREECPWDKKQTMDSLRYLTIEEMYELSDAILEKDMEEIKKELTTVTLPYLSISSEVSPEYREVERASTTVLNAYVGPIMSTYLSKLEKSLEQLQSSASPPTLHIIQSDGGAATRSQIEKLPISTLLSGPAAGVNGAFSIAKAVDEEQIITLDIGGTSTDIALCDKELPYRTNLVIEGIHARTPVVDIHTIGAGGGSIAYLDTGGALRVGPRSTGSFPGPACYGNSREFP